MDLQMQLPPQQLLQLLLEMISQQQQQQQQDDAADDRGSNSSSTAAAGEADQAAAAAAAEVVAGGLPFSIAHSEAFELDSIRGLVAVTNMLDSYAALKQAITEGNSSSSSSSSNSSSSSRGSLNESIAHALLQHCLRINSTRYAQHAPKLPVLHSTSDLACVVAAMPTVPPQQQQQQQQLSEVTAAAAALIDLAAAADADGGSNTPPAAAAATPALVGTDVLYCFLHSMAVNIILSFVEQAWEAGRGAALPAWQQAVPLQALLLCGELTHVVTWLKKCLVQPETLLGSSSSSSSSGTDVNGTCCSEATLDATGSDQQQGEQQQHCTSHALESNVSTLLTKLTGMLQMVRQFKEANEALNTSTTAAAAACIVGGSGDSASTSSSSSSSGVQPMDPVTFFSSTGPLASGALGFGEPSWAGIFSSSTSAAAAAAAAARSSSQPRGSEVEAAEAAVRSQDHHHHHHQQQQQQQELHRQLWGAAVGNGIWDNSVAQIDRALQHQIASPRFLSCATRSCEAKATDQTDQIIMSSKMSGYAAASTRHACDKASDVAEDLRSIGIEVPQTSVLAVQSAAAVCAAQIMVFKGCLLKRVGLTGKAGRRFASAHRDQGVKLIMEQLRHTGAGLTVLTGAGDVADTDMLMTSSSSNSSSSSSSSEDEDDDQQQQQQQEGPASAASSSRDKRFTRRYDDITNDGQSNGHADSALSAALDIPDSTLGCGMRWGLQARRAAAAAAAEVAAATGLSAKERRRLLRNAQGGYRWVGAG
jgi:hypothetical protein